VAREGSRIRAAGKPPVVRIATFNILHGRSLSDGVVDVDRLAAAVRDLDADVLALQEVDRDQPRSHVADLTAVAAEAMGAVSHRFAAALTGTPGAAWTTATGDEQPPGIPAYGVALLSRFPARSWRVVRMPRLPVRVPVWIPGANKLTVLKEEPRVAVVGTFDTPLGTLTAASTHLSFVPGWNHRQLAQLRRELATHQEPVIILGDFNMLAPRLAGHRPLARTATFPAGGPRLQLDHILARGELPPVIATRAVETVISDHRALVTDLADAPDVRSRPGVDDTMP
jgi:endonuclease/exonuclease/phosphatase family metal-dependent hydrolase